MAITAEQIAEVRRLANEPTQSPYTDALIIAIAEKFQMIDERGEKPYYWNQLGGVPVKVTNTFWIPTYDLNATISQIWSEKCSQVVLHFDFSADGGDYKQSQEYIQADAMARYFLAKSSVKTIMQTIAVDEDSGKQSWIGNLPESD